MHEKVCCPDEAGVMVCAKIVMRVDAGAGARVGGRGGSRLPGRSQVAAQLRRVRFERPVLVPSALARAQPPCA